MQHLKQCRGKEGFQLLFSLHSPFEPQVIKNIVVRCLWLKRGSAPCFMLGHEVPRASVAARPGAHCPRKPLAIEDQRASNMHANLSKLDYVKTEIVNMMQAPSREDLPHVNWVIFLSEETALMPGAPFPKYSDPTKSWTRQNTIQFSNRHKDSEISVYRDSRRAHSQQYYSGFRSLGNPFVITSVIIYVLQVMLQKDVAVIDLVKGSIHIKGSCSQIQHSIQ